jgi:hypothetical protein
LIWVVQNKIWGYFEYVNQIHCFCLHTFSSFAVHHQRHITPSLDRTNLFGQPFWKQFHIFGLYGQPKSFLLTFSYLTTTRNQWRGCRYHPLTSTMAQIEQENRKCGYHLALPRNMMKQIWQSLWKGWMPELLSSIL